MRTAARLVSIDFDGVLSPTGTGATTVKTPLFGWLPHLERLLAPHPDVRVLVHSSWREVYQPEELQMMLGALEPRFVGAAPRGPRYASLLQWLHYHANFTSYRILDDDPTEFPSPPPRELIICDPLRGVSDPTVQAVVRSWLEGSGHG